MLYVDRAAIWRDATDDTAYLKCADRGIACFWSIASGQDKRQQEESVVRCRSRRRVSVYSGSEFKASAATAFVEEGQRVCARAAGSVKTPMRRANVSAMQMAWLFACSLFGPEKLRITVSTKSVTHLSKCACCTGKHSVLREWRALIPAGPKEHRFPEAIHRWQMRGPINSSYLVEHRREQLVLIYLRIESIDERPYICRRFNVFHIHNGSDLFGVRLRVLC